MRITFQGNRPQRGRSQAPAGRPWDNPSAYGGYSYPNTAKDQIRQLLASEDAYILDTETTGLKGDDVRVIELSIIDMDGNVVFHSLFNPQASLPEKIPELTGITDEMLRDEPFFFSKLNEILTVIMNRKLIAWNADFDRERMTRELIAAGVGSPVLSSIEWVDAMELYSHSQGRSRKWTKLIVAKEEMGIGESQEHRSTADCLDTLAVLRAAVREEGDLLSAAEEEAE